MTRTGMSLFSMFLAITLSGTAYAGGVTQTVNTGVGNVNSGVNQAGQNANGAIDSVNKGLFGLVDSFAPGGGEPGSGNATTLSTTPSGGSPTLLAGGKIGVNPYTVNCDTSQFASAVAETVAKVDYRPSLSSNICGIGGLSNVNLTDLSTLGSGMLQKAFCSAVKMVAEPVIDTANDYIDQADGMTGIDYFNQLSDQVEDLSDVESVIDNYSSNNSNDSSSGSSNNSSGGSAAPRNLLTQLDWDEIGVTRSMDLGAEDILSVRFTVPEYANNKSGNFNVGGTGAHDVVLSSARGAMANANSACRIASSANATLRFVVGSNQFGRCNLQPGEMYYLNVRQNNAAGKAAIRLFHN